MLEGGLFVLFIIVAVLVGAVVGYILKQIFTAKKIKASESLAARIVGESKKEAETIKKEAILQAKENLLKMKADFDRETKDFKNDLEALERRIRSKEENLDKRIDTLSQKEASIEGREKGLSQKEHALEEKTPADGRSGGRAERKNWRRLPASRRKRQKTYLSSRWSRKPSVTQPGLSVRLKKKPSSRGIGRRGKSLPTPFKDTRGTMSRSIRFPSSTCPAKK